MTHHLLVVLPAALLLAACTTLGLFAEVDANRDGGVSPDEARRNGDLIALFNSVDEDQNGVLNEEEYELARKVILSSRETTRRAPPVGGGSGGGHSH